MTASLPSPSTVRVILADGHDGEVGVGPLALLLDRAQGLLRENEDDGDGLELGDDHDASHIAGMDDVALVHQPDADAPVNGGD